MGRGQRKIGKKVRDRRPLGGSGAAGGRDRAAGRKNLREGFGEGDKVKVKKGWVWES